MSQFVVEEQVPNHSLEMEMAVLGSYMIDPNAYRLTRNILTAESFYRNSHQEIFKAVKQLEAEGQTTELAVVCQWLKDKGKLDEIGGFEYVSQVYEYVPSARSAIHYAKIVAEKAELRAYHLACRNVISKINNNSDIDEIRTLVQGLPASAKRTSAFLELGDIDATGEDTGVSTGLTGIDNGIATKGYPDGQMSMISAYHKAGKSTFMVQSFCHMANEGHRVLYATFADLNAKRLKRRMLRCLSGWSKMPKDADLFGDDAKKFEQALTAIEKIWDAEVFDASKTDSDTIESFLAQLEAKHMDKPYRCVFIDYAQKLTSENRRARYGGVAEGDWISHAISRAAERLNLAIVVGSQITEGGKEGKTITKGSRKWEEDAGLVLRIKRENQSTAKIAIEYSRFGGMGTEVDCYWIPETLTFQEMNP